MTKADGGTGKERKEGRKEGWEKQGTRGARGGGKMTA